MSKKKTLPATPSKAKNTYKTEWDFSLYYTSENDPKLEADIKATEQAYTRFAKKWRNKDFTTNPKLLAEALAEKEAIAGNPDYSRPMRYFYLRTAVNTADMVALKQMTLIERRLREAGDKTLFFTLELGKVDKKTQTQLLKAPELKHFRYYLEQLFLGAKHHLSEAEEKIISLKSSQSYGRWTDMTDRILSERQITWKGKKVNLPHALELLEETTFADKPKLWALISKETKQISEVAEHEFNAIINDVRGEEKLRGYKKPYSSTALSYQDKEQSIEQLIDVVTKEGFKLSREFYKLKAAYHGVDILKYPHRNQTAGEGIKITFDEAVNICRETFHSVKPEYALFFDTMLENGQIDVFPKPGKSGGAFMSSTTGHPINVFLNHTSDYNSLTTLAHEMGHAIHSFVATQSQTPFYSDYSTIVAETASTLFEALVFEDLYKKATDDEKVKLLHDRIMRDIATIQRQVAFFNCELEIHNTIEAEGAMSGAELARCMQKHLKSYLGDAVEVTEDDGYSYTYVRHLRYGFYVFTYPYGQLMSSLIAADYHADKKNLTKIEKMLAAGQSKPVSAIYKDIGYDTTKAETFSKSLAKMKDDINTWKKLLKKRAK